MARLRVGVLFGGRSSEHEVSLASARCVLSNLDPQRYDIVPIGITRAGSWLRFSGTRAALEGMTLGGGGEPLALLPDPSLRRPMKLVQAQPALRAAVAATAGPEAAPASEGGEMAALDVVIPVLHGRYGEDGTIQGLLELADIPYVGAGVLGSALGLDKAVMKRLFTAAGLPVLPYKAFTRNRWRAQPQAILEELGSLSLPCFVKPANTGSSVGVSRVDSKSDLREAVELACRHDAKVVVEEAAVNCRELECAILGNHDPVASVVAEVRLRPGTPHLFYDYAAKYEDDSAEVIIPADLPRPFADRLRSTACQAFQAVEGAGMARVDFFGDPARGLLWLNEVNTIPGFTPISAYPRMWEATDMPIPALLDRLIELALERHAEKRESERGAGL
jgi:D-alanine-D-alanine ligase